MTGKVVVGVDIGSAKIATVVAKIDDEINVLGVSEVVSEGIRKGQIVDIKKAVDSITTSLDSAERMAGYSISRVVASIGGGHIESQNSRGVVAVAAPHGEVNPSDLSRVIDAARAVSLPSTREIIHVLPRNYIVDGQEGIKDPIGMTGVRLEVDTHIISANAVSLRNLEKALSQIGVDVDAVVFSGYASSLAVVTETEKELGVIVADIGAGTTDISLYYEGSVAYSSVLPIGARHITNDIAIGLRISLESAEKIKLFLSKPIQGRVKIGVSEVEKHAKDMDEIDLGYLGITEDINKVSRKTLVEGIIRPRLNEIFTMIGLEIKRSGFGGQTPSGIVLTGGGARTVAAVECAKRTLGMPVRVGVPVNIKGLIDEIQNPSFAAVIGLIVYGSTIETSSALPFGISMPQMQFLSFGKVLPRFLKFLKSF
ncbi:MAG: cell division protein FtsA, partial [Candidatus Levybacteria bacterium RIFCSPHIGHO2_01_FULL_38_26]